MILIAVRCNETSTSINPRTVKYHLYFSKNIIPELPRKANKTLKQDAQVALVNNPDIKLEIHAINPDVLSLTPKFL